MNDHTTDACLRAGLRAVADYALEELEKLDLVKEVKKTSGDPNERSWDLTKIGGTEGLANYVRAFLPQLAARWHEHDDKSPSVILILRAPPMRDSVWKFISGDAILCRDGLITEFRAQNHSLSEDGFVELVRYGKSPKSQLDVCCSGSHITWGMRYSDGRIVGDAGLFNPIPTQC